MLKITIPAIETYDEISNEFITTKEQTLQLEHSLVSLSKWESKWLKPFLSKTERTREETIDYIRCMTITQNVSPSVYRFVPDSVIKQVTDYIDAPMTATKINNMNRKPSREIITAEIIYYSMIALNIPFECQKWHLNRLMTLIDVCSIKNGPQKKMSRSEILSQNKALNAARHQALRTKG